VGLSQLRTLLEQGVGVRSFQFIIPHPFLPPRFRKISENRNMILLIDQDVTMYARWEGERLERHQPLSKGAVRQLLREVTQRMKDYRRDLEIYGRFIESQGEEPFGGSRYEFPTIPRELDGAEQKKVEIKPDKDNTPKLTAYLLMGTSAAEDMGGESPIPRGEWENE